MIKFGTIPDEAYEICTKYTKDCSFYQTNGYYSQIASYQITHSNGSTSTYFSSSSGGSSSFENSSSNSFGGSNNFGGSSSNSFEGSNSNFGGGSIGGSLGAGGHITSSFESTNTGSQFQTHHNENSLGIGGITQIEIGSGGIGSILTEGTSQESTTIHGPSSSHEIG